MPDNNSSLFNGKADNYARFRPSYPDAVIDFLYNNAKCEHVADVGAGTGIFTQCLTRKPWKITAIEPNLDMRLAFTNLLPDIPCLPNTAENTGLPDASVGLVTVAQAFHWLDENAFKLECLRILKPHGYIAIIWNTSKKSPISDARDNVTKVFCSIFRDGHVGKRSQQEGDNFLRTQFFKNVTVFSCTHSRSLNEQQFIGETLSRSYALFPDNPDFNRFVSELRTAFRNSAINGIATEVYDATAYLGQF